ncbi:hypothetical protein NKG05_28910 [Oerskovia sp. M15]
MRWTSAFVVVLTDADEVVETQHRYATGGASVEESGPRDGRRPTIRDGETVAALAVAGPWPGRSA